MKYQKEEFSHSSKLFEQLAPGDATMGPWIVSYADMITLMLIFFALFYSPQAVYSHQQTQLKQAKQVKEEKLMHVNMLLDTIELPPSLKATLEIYRDNNQLVADFSENILFFGSGEIHIHKSGEQVLKELAEIIKDLPPEVSVRIEGHTDQQPLGKHSVYKDNWELSAVRAARVAAFFIQEGVSSDRVSVVGWADQKLKLPEWDFDHKRPLASDQLTKIRAANRRISFVFEVKNEYTQDNQGIIE